MLKNYWLNQLKAYGEAVDHDPTEYFIPIAEYIDVVRLLVEKGYFKIEDVMRHELKTVEQFGYEFMMKSRYTMSFMDMMEFIDFECDGDWETYPSLMWAAEYLASDIASPLDKAFFSNPEMWRME